MLFGGAQQVDEVADDVRPDGFILEQPGNGGQRLFVCRNREMIAPEVHESFVEGCVGTGGRAIPGGRLLK